MRTCKLVASCAIVIASTHALLAADGDQNGQGAATDRPVIALLNSQASASARNGVTGLSNLTDVELTAQLAALKAEAARRKDKQGTRTSALSNPDAQSPAKTVKK